MFPCIPGVSLKKGCLVIGAVEIAFAILGGIFYTLGLFAVGDYENLNQIKNSQGEGYFVIPFVNLDGRSSLEDVESTLIIIFSLALVGCLVYCFIGSLLIFATNKGESRLLKTWIVCQSLFIGSAFIYMLVTLVLGYTTTLSLICDFLTTCVQLYFLWIVYSFIVRLRDEQTFTMSPTIRKTGETIEASFPLETFSSKESYKS